MKYGGKEIKEMSDAELVQLNEHLTSVLNNTLEKRNDERFKPKFKNSPSPQLNPAFVEVKNAVLEEINKRNINNGY